MPRKPQQTRRVGRSVPRFQPVKPISEVAAAYYEFINDLTNYVGIGTLKFIMPRRAAAGMEAPDGWLWLEDHPWPNGYAPGDIAKKTRELLLKSLVRLTYRMVSESEARVRVYVLPEDVGRSIVAVNSGPTVGYLQKVMMAVDTSVPGWNGELVEEKKPVLGYDDETLSLFYLFNTINSPAPDPNGPWVKEERVRKRLKNVLGETPFPECQGDGFRGLRTMPFKYQRRSIAMMLQREMAPEKVIDSRLKETTAPSGEVYYIDLDNLKIYESPVYYDDVRGGILAEEMGTGKTIMCIGAITATKGEYSQPPENRPIVTPEPAIQPMSFVDICITAIWKDNLWFPDDMPAHWESAFYARHAYYKHPASTRSRSRRQSTLSNSMEKIFLGKGTIVVCPQNLVGQWKSEIDKHVEPGFLKVAILDQLDSKVPEIPDLLKYDILLFSRNRFDQEHREGMDELGRRAPYGAAISCQCPYIGATRIRDCHCFDVNRVYKSPLMSVRWKRIIIDEGHFLGSGGKTRGISVAERLNVERRWIVTGTPSNNLLGVTAGVTSIVGESPKDKRLREQKALEERKAFQEDEEKDLEKLGNMVKDYLRLRPWAPCEDRRDHASWKTYITKGFYTHRIGSTECVRNILQKLVIRHTAEDIEKSHQFPPLYHNIVRLKPRFYEKLSMNLFVMALAVNAVTSEREDEDYMFHPKNARELRLLTNNLLKEAGFFWTGTARDDVESTIKIAQNFLQERRGGTGLNLTDRMLLQLAIYTGRQAIKNSAWNGLSLYHEMGYFISGLPLETLEKWAVTQLDHAAPLIGATQVLELQKFIHDHAYEHDADRIFSVMQEKGESFMPGYRERIFQEKKKLDKKYKPSRLEERRGIVASAISEQASSHISTPKQQSRGASSGTKMPTSHGMGKKAKGRGTSKAPANSAVAQHSLEQEQENNAVVRSILKTPTERPPTIPPSPAMAAKIIGTTSTKLSYLLSAIQRHQATEKILIFYETPNIASYISQGLDALGIQWVAIARSLPGATKAKYIIAFHHLPRFRVLLLDLSQAAHGLNICSASRVYFVNPVWTPSIEAQALKRAHRIGQTRPVYVETLVLEGTLEDEMVKRRSAMSDSEISKTQDNIVNDNKMREIISNLEFYQVDDDEGVGMEQVALLDSPEPMFGDKKKGGQNFEENTFLAGLDEVGEEINKRSQEVPREPERDQAAALGLPTPLPTPTDDPPSSAGSVQQAGSSGSSSSVFGGEASASRPQSKRTVMFVESPEAAPPSKSVRFG